MNSLRRKTLRKVTTFLGKLKEATNDEALVDKLRQCADDVEKECDAEQDCLDNIPENLMWSDRAGKISDNVDDLSDALCSIQSIIETYETTDVAPYEQCAEDIQKAIKSINNSIL